MIEDGENVNLKLEPSAVEKWKELSSRFKIDEETDQFLSSLFGDFLDLFYDQEKQLGNEKWRHLAVNFLNLVLDSGLRRPINLFNETLNPVLMLGRMGGVSWLKDKIGLEEKDENGEVCYGVEHEDFSILRLDVANVFEANQIENGKGGDYLLNKVAQAINEAVDNLRADIEILPVRYGGDEFVIFVKGQLDDEQIRAIKGEITKREAYYGDKGQKRRISLKGDKIEIINPLEITDPLKKQLFYSFLSRGVILSPDELENEYQKISQREEGINEEERIKKYIKEASARRIYPTEIEELKDENERTQRKIEYLIRIHPEFRVPFYLAWYLDERDSPSSLIRQQRMLKILEDYLVDPLLDEVVITRFDLKNHLEQGERMLIFELKLKEINDDKTLGYGYGDLLIVETWRRIKEILGEKLVNKFKIMRFGGTIGLCFSQGITLTDEKISQLENLQLSLDGVTHDVGFADILLNGEEMKDLSDERKEQIVQEIFTQPDLNWLKKRSLFIITDEKIFSLFVKKLKEGTAQINEEELQDPNLREQLELLLSYFLNEARGKARREKLRSVLSEIISEIDDDKKKEEILSLLAKL